MQLIWEGLVEAFKLLFSLDSEVLQITFLSLQISGLATGVSLLLGLPLGTLLALGEFPTRRFWLSLVNTGMALPPVVVGLGVSIMLWRNGPLGFLRLIYTPGAIILAQTIIAAPLVVGLTVTALQQLRPAPPAAAAGVRRLTDTSDLDSLARSPPPSSGCVNGWLWQHYLRSRCFHDGWRKSPLPDPRIDYRDCLGNQPRGICYRHCIKRYPSHPCFLGKYGINHDPAAKLPSKKVIHLNPIIEDPLLEIRSLVVSGNSGKTILKLDQLRVSRGEVLIVIGPNGSGKSTLLLSIARLLQPDNGQIFLKNEEITRGNELGFRRKIGLVFQDPLLLKRTVFENVAAGLKFRGVSTQETEERTKYWLERFGISHLRDRSGQQISGGEAQRTSLARAFVLDPEVLLLDEPFSALDSPTRSRLIEDLQALLEDTGITTIFVTHDMNEALILGDRVLVMLNGQLRQIGRPDQVFSAPADPEVAQFVGVETVIPGIAQAGQEGLVRVETGKFTFDCVGTVAPGREVLLCLRPEDVVIWRQAEMPKTSARNRLSGTIVRMVPQGPLLKVVCDAGFPIVALITQASADEMNLKPGQTIWASFKATVGHLIVR